METRVAVMSIIVENTNSIESLNNILHEYREYIIGRMGLPILEVRADYGQPYSYDEHYC